jgi:hypothetical protein
VDLDIFLKKEKEDDNIKYYFEQRKESTESYLLNLATRRPLEILSFHYKFI